MPKTGGLPEQTLQKALVSVIEFFLLNGVQPARIRNIVENRLAIESAHSVKGRESSKSKKVRSADTVAAVVLQRWHREPTLMDERAYPKPLPLFGRSPSLEALVRAEHPGETAKSIVRSMRAMGLVRLAANAKYLPVSRVATVSSPHPILLEHVSSSIARFLATVERNTSSAGKKHNLIERFTQIPDLSPREFAAFREFSQRHGSSFLASVDDWLEARRAKFGGKDRKSGVAAGIHVFGYIDQASVPSISIRTKRPRRAKRA